MKKIFFMICASTVIFTGCESHYYKVSKGMLSLYLKTQNAGSVELLSSIDSYSPHLAKKIDTETWEVTLPHTSGFTYFYLVDGEVYVPPCRFKETDDFGSENCLFIPGL